MLILKTIGLRNMSADVCGHHFGAIWQAAVLAPAMKPKVDVGWRAGLQIIYYLREENRVLRVQICRSLSRPPRGELTLE